MTELELKAGELACVFCGEKLSTPKQIKECPKCGKRGVFRARTALGSLTYCSGTHAGCVSNQIDPDVWSPDDLSAIAADLRVQEETDQLLYPDGSGSTASGGRRYG
jgi:predicted RNA-binding Zn-ribbon protein involved in translation (DUF1610 family)